jgi:hypothetical protein
MLPKDPLLPATLSRAKVKDFIKTCMHELGLTRGEAKQLYNETPDMVLRNGTYAVFVYKQEPHGLKGMKVWHLSIKRHDKEVIHDWRELQEIKNQVCGFEAEAMELYPAESRLMDHANQYHLYAIMTHDTDGKYLRVPVGYTDTGTGPNRTTKGFLGSKNRRFV